MVTTTEYNAMRNSLMNQGYDRAAIDQWAAKEVYYRHRVDKFEDGTISDGVGTAIRLQPGHPQEMVRQATRGRFKFPPSPDHEDCEWCPETFRNAYLVCDKVYNRLVCGHIVSSETTQGATSSMRKHHKDKHPE